MVSLKFFIDIKSFRSHYGPGVDSASNRNEYQEPFLGVKADNLTTILYRCREIWEPELPGTFSATPGLQRGLLYPYLYLMIGGNRADTRSTNWEFNYIDSFVNSYWCNFYTVAFRENFKPTTSLYIRRHSQCFAKNVRWITTLRHKYPAPGKPYANRHVIFRVPSRHGASRGELPPLIPSPTSVLLVYHSH